MNKAETFGIYAGCAVLLLSCFLAIAWHHFDEKNNNK